MEINVAQQLKGPVGSVRSYEVSEVIDFNGDGGSITVYGKVRLMHTNRGILVKGVLHTEVEVTCSRCLDLFRCPLTLNIEEEYFPTIDVVSGVPVPVPDEPDCFAIDECHILDLTEAIRQYSVMAIPMKLLCRPDCAGLCPSCGQNLNEGSCSCPGREMNPCSSELARLAPAIQILENKKKGTE